MKLIAKLEKEYIEENIKILILEYFTDKPSEGATLHLLEDINFYKFDNWFLNVNIAKWAAKSQYGVGEDDWKILED